MADNRKKPTKKKTSGSSKTSKKKPARELTASVVKDEGPRRSYDTSSNNTKKTSGSRPRNTEKQRRPITEKELRAKKDRTDEIAGLILITLGIVMCILTYARTGAALEGAVDFLFGLLGVMQYVLPPLLIVLGIFIIAAPNRQFGSGTTITCLVALFCVSCVIHIAASSPIAHTFKSYITSAYTLGKARAGGGFLASMTVFGLAKLLSKAGAIVVFVAAALILFLLATKISIRTAGRKVIARVDAMEDRRKARLYEETEDDEDDERARAKRRRRLSETEILPEPDTEPEEALLLGEDPESDTLTGSLKRKRRFGKKARSSDEKIDTLGYGALADGEHELELMPRTGAIPVKNDDHGTLDFPETEHAFPSVPEDPPFPEEDPFASFPPIPEEIPVEAPPAELENEAENEPVPEETEPPVPEEAIPMQVYQKPPLSLLRKPEGISSVRAESPAEKARLLLETLANFNIEARLVDTSVGPAVTRFEIQLAPGIRVSKITGLSNDIALALAAPRVRIEAPIPGKAAIGIDIPNKDTELVTLREVLDTREFSAASSPLTFALGKDIAGKPVYANLEKMPHMLIAGSTGSGKSVCINSIILSTVYKSTPDEVRMILIDPKVVELSIFAPVPHLYCPVVTDPKKAAGVLKWACNEMDNRYDRMGKINARDLARFNALQTDPAERLPRLMIIIDELSDLMTVSSKDVEESIVRLAQLGRASGIHLIVATQRPSVDVITGLIKTNIPSRIAFAVSSAIDSRVILDSAGAEKLLGRGDMLFHPNGAAKPVRAQGAFVSDEEVEAVMDFFKEHKLEIEQNMSVLDSIPDLTSPVGQGNGKQEDDLLPSAVRIVMESGSASISMIQRRLRVGYARAARLVDEMEKLKIVSGFDGSKPRNVLIDEAGFREMFGSGENA